MNQSHPFRSYISSYATLSDEEWAAIEPCLTKRVYQKNELLLRAGAICKKLYFLESGYLMYYVLKDGEEVTKYFTEPPYCFTSQRSFDNEIPTQDNILALEESVVWEMSRTHALDLLRFKGWSEFVRKLILEVQFYTEEILDASQNKTAEERYLDLLDHNSIILQKASLKQIASYLGIAPQSLSRIRKNIVGTPRT